MTYLTAMLTQVGIQQQMQNASKPDMLNEFKKAIAEKTNGKDLSNTQSYQQVITEAANSFRDSGDANKQGFYNEVLNKQENGITLIQTLQGLKPNEKDKRYPVTSTIENSSQYKAYCQTNGITLNTSTPSASRVEARLTTGVTYNLGGGEDVSPVGRFTQFDLFLNGLTDPKGGVGFQYTSLGQGGNLAAMYNRRINDKFSVRGGIGVGSVNGDGFLGQKKIAVGDRKPFASITTETQSVFEADPFTGNPIPGSEKKFPTKTLPLSLNVGAEGQVGNKFGWQASTMFTSQEYNANVILEYGKPKNFVTPYIQLGVNGEYRKQATPFIGGGVKADFHNIKQAGKGLGKFVRGIGGIFSSVDGIEGGENVSPTDLNNLTPNPSPASEVGRNEERVV